MIEIKAMNRLNALVTAELEAFAAELRATHSGDYGENNCPICDDIDRLLAEKKQELER